VAVFVVGPTGVESLEWLEQPLYVAGREYQSGVGDRHHGLSAVGDRGGDLNVSAGQVVADGVVDQVGDETLDEPAVSIEPSGADRGLDMQSEGVGVEVWSRQDIVAHAGEVDRFATVESAFAAGEREQGFDEASLFSVGRHLRLSGLGRC
jgi:hypothetical protein